MTITLPIARIKSVLKDVVDLISQVGETVTYTFHDGTPAKQIRVILRKLNEYELVGTYRETDLKLIIDTDTLPKPPEKFDTVTDAAGNVYSILDHIHPEKGIDDTNLVYQTVVRGGE